MNGLVRMFGPPGTDEANHGEQKFRIHDDDLGYALRRSNRSARSAGLLSRRTSGPQVCPKSGRLEWSPRRKFFGAQDTATARLRNRRQRSRPYLVEKSLAPPCDAARLIYAAGQLARHGPAASVFPIAK